MTLLPSWPTVLAGIIVGVLIGGYADHTYMTHKLDKLVTADAEQERARQVQRAADEVTARNKEQSWVDIIGQNEQEHQNEVAKIRAAGAAAIAGVQNRPDRQPTGTGGVRQTSTDCKGATGAELSRPDSEFLIRLGQRADEQRAALNTCYSAYETIR